MPNTTTSPKDPCAILLDQYVKCTETGSLDDCEVERALYKACRKSESKTTK